MHDLFPTSAKFINAGISATNLVVTLAASFFFDRIDHKVLLLASMVSMSIFSATLALSILLGWAVLSAAATLLFVASFSIGLGPLPWMVAAQKMEARSVGAAQSVALTANWAGTFLVGFGVPVVADAYGMPVVFVCFTALGFMFFVWGFFSL